MQYDLGSPLQKVQARRRLEALEKKGAVIEITEKSFRTTRQNSYLHTIIGIVAMETGVTLEYAKQNYFKALVNPDLFVVEQTDRFAGKVRTLRSSADLTKEEMTMAIDRFKRWAYEQGIAIPEQGDDELLKEAMIEMGRNRAYIGGTW